MSAFNPYTIRPVDIADGTWGGYKVVAVAGYDNDWAAYQGLLDWSDDRVRQEGDKLGREAAEALFPALKRTGRVYR